MLVVVLRLTAIIVVGTTLQIGLGGADALSGASGTAAVVDSEVRFLLAFWIAYGATCWWVAGDLAERAHLSPLLAGAIGLGALLRLVSAVQFGSPGLTYVVAIVIEAALAIGIWGAHRTHGRRDGVGPGSTP